LLGAFTQVTNDGLADEVTSYITLVRGHRVGTLTGRIRRGAVGLVHVPAKTDVLVPGQEVLRRGRASEAQSILMAA